MIRARCQAFTDSNRRQMARSCSNSEYEPRGGPPVRHVLRLRNRTNSGRCYAGLGAVGDFSDALILFAFARQTAVDLENRSYYYECLQDLAIGRKSEELEMQVAFAGSRGFTSRKEVEGAYRYFGIEPAHALHINDEHIIGTFKSRLSDMSPSLAEETRRQLRIIGDARDSATIRAEAADALETYQQALSWLDLTDEQADDFVPTMVSLKVCWTPRSGWHHNVLTIADLGQSRVHGNRAQSSSFNCRTPQQRPLTNLPPRRQHDSARDGYG